MLALEGQVAIVTGGASGIGRCTAVEFAAAGASVLVVDIDSEGGNQTVRCIRDAGGEAEFYGGDVSISDTARGAVSRVVERFGRLTILVNNASATSLCNKEDRSVDELPEWVWDKMIAVCLKSVFLFSKYAIPEMKKSGGGAILNLATVNAVIAEAGFDSYTAAKGGVLALTRSMAAAYGADGIRVNCLSPGHVETECQAGWINDPYMRAMSESLHLTRLGKPEDVSRFALFLVDPRNEYLTGGNYFVDGGFTCFKTPAGVKLSESAL